MLGTLSLLVANIVSWRHTAIQPWCPWCRHPGDGDDEYELVPDDPGGVERPVPSI